MADPDLQIRGSGEGGERGGGHPDPEIRGKGTLQASVVWSKNKGGSGPPGPSPGFATVLFLYFCEFTSLR